VKLGADVLARHIEAQRQAGLEQQAGARGLRQDVAIELDPDRPRALADVHPMERIERVTGDPLVLLVPVVEGVEVERHVAGQILVREPEPGAHAVLDRDRLARGRVHAERDPGVQHAGHVAIARRRRSQLGPDVLHGHGEGRHDAARLPDQDRTRAVDNRLRAQVRPHALLDRLMA
jgi:hypothetical protein